MRGRQGEHLIARLKGAKKQISQLIHDVRGQGLMIGLELADFSRTLPYGLRHASIGAGREAQREPCGFRGMSPLARLQRFGRLNGIQSQRHPT